MSMRRLAQGVVLAFLGVVFISTWLLVLGVPIYVVFLLQFSVALVAGGIVWWFSVRNPREQTTEEFVAEEPPEDEKPKLKASKPAQEETPTEPMATPNVLPKKVPSGFPEIDLRQAKDQLRSKLGTQAGDAPTAEKMSQAKMLPGARAAMERFGLVEGELRKSLAKSRPRPAEQGRYQFVVGEHSVIVSEDDLRRGCRSL